MTFIKLEKRPDDFYIREIFKKYFSIMYIFVKYEIDFFQTSHFQVYSCQQLKKAIYFVLNFETVKLDQMAKEESFVDIFGHSRAPGSERNELLQLSIR